MAEIFAESIAMTNGWCEGPHEEEPMRATQVVSFRVHVGHNDRGEALAYLDLCDRCRERCEAREGVTLHFKLNGPTTLTFEETT